MIGYLTVRLFIREARSLKDKRQVVRSILERLRGEFRIAAAEIDLLDDHRQATLGFAAVGPEADGIRSTLLKIQEALRTHPIAEHLGSELHLGREVV